jgi:ring-1,2-phenylacetyl-CoA epoxidase subunit PaaA
VNGNGPCNKERLATRVQAWRDGQWVRDAAMASAQKKREKEQAA